VLRFPVGDGAHQQLLQWLARMAGAVAKQCQCMLHFNTTDVIRHLAHPAWAAGLLTQRCEGYGLFRLFPLFRGYFLSRSHCYFLLLPAWPRKVRVGANSPNLWPTMFSVTYTGMNLFPLCTAKVNPTNSGVMVLARDQVFSTVFLPACCMSVTRFAN